MEGSYTRWPERTMPKTKPHMTTSATNAKLPLTAFELLARLDDGDMD